MRILERTFWRKFGPIKNHISEDASFEGCLFETFGEELAFVTNCDPTKIWTLIESEGKTYVCSGFRLVNRLGYFVTEKSFGKLDLYFKV